VTHFEAEELFTLWRVDEGDIVVSGIRCANGWIGYHLRTENIIHDPVYREFHEDDWCEVVV
jgi:hypothetical protein